jgi:hypothetical protein
MKIDNDVKEALELCGFIKGERQESRLMSLLSAVLELQTEPPTPLEFGQIYDQLMISNPSLNLSKQWVNRVLNQLVESELVRLENPTSRKKRYIADVNTVMAGLERMKSNRMEEIESERQHLDKELEKISSLDCGALAKSLVEGFIGKEQKISSRVVRGVEELHRILRYNMLDVAKEGDIIRATVLWFGPFLDNTTRDRTLRFINAAKRGAEIRYFVSTDLFRFDSQVESMMRIEPLVDLMQNLVKLREAGVKFNARLYAGEKTYNQISFNRQSTVLIIAENPVTATWITRDFNPDLIDNAVAAFDRDWAEGKSIFDLTLDDLEAFGVSPEGPISKVLVKSKEQ